MNTQNLRLIAYILIFVASILLFYLLFTIFSSDSNLNIQNDSNRVTMFETIDFELVSQNDISAKGYATKIYTKDHKIKAENPKVEAVISGNNIDISSDTLIGDKQTLIFKGNVTANSSMASMNTAKMKVDVRNKTLSGSENIVVNAENILISGKEYNVNIIDNTISFCGNVLLIQGEHQLKCERILCKLKKENKKYVIDVVECYGNITVDSNELKIQATERGIYRNGLLSLYGNVAVTGKNNGHNMSLYTSNISASFSGKYSIKSVQCNSKFTYTIDGNVIIGGRGYLKNNCIFVEDGITIKSAHGTLRGDSGIYDLKTGKSTVKEPKGVFFHKVR